MRRIALTIILIAFVTGSGRLIAEPSPSENCSCPKPVGGMQELEKNTIYPKIAKKHAFQGKVIVQFYVDRAGNVTQVHVLQSGGPLFDKSATQAIEKTQWKPAMQNGEPVPVQYAQAFSYKFRY